MHYLLDTDTCIDILRGADTVLDRAKDVSPDDCAVSTVTAYELLTGAEKCRSPASERAKVEVFLSNLHELSFDHAAANRTAQIRSDLERRGLMIGPYDVMLAGQALAEGLVLVTSNTDEFRRVKGLRTADWRLP